MHDAQVQAILTTIMIAIFGGVFLIALARKFNIPAIILLLVAGAGLGPIGLDLVEPDSLGKGLKVLVLLCISLILFEGGLTLNVSGYKSASGVIKRLLTIGVLTTWFSAALAIWAIEKLEPAYAVLAGSLIIVTGPTVISPMLKRIRINAKLNSILHWEGVLIDPIGVFVAVMCLEWVIGGHGGEAVTFFMLRIGSGMAIGILGGKLISWIVSSEFIPEDMLNNFILGSAVLLFGMTELIASEAGLLTVTVAGLVIGIRKPQRIKQIKKFKAELTDLLIGVLFILLASRLTIDQFQSFGYTGVIIVAIVVFVVRPVSIALCAHGSGLTTKERVFLSWIAPRGIVAASMASLIRLELDGEGEEQAGQFIETFTYSVIMSTIILQGASAGWLAGALKLKRKEPTGWLIVGGHALGRSVAKFLQSAGLSVLIVDSNSRAIRETESAGLRAIRADARDPALAERFEFGDVGNVLAITDNEDLNHLICHRWLDVVGGDHIHMFGVTPPATAGHRVVGKRVWMDLPVPSVIGGEMDHGDAMTVATEGVNPSSDANRAPLAAIVNDGRVIIDPASRDGYDPAKMTSVLWLQRKAEYFLRSLKDNLIFRSEAPDRDKLFEELIDRVVEVYPQLSRNETLQEMCGREKTFPTALGHGIAIPHAYSGDLPRRVCAVVQIPNGIEFDAPDSKPVHLAFMVLSPKGDPEGHLATLADIARLADNESVRESLLRADSAGEIAKIIHDNWE